MKSKNIKKGLKKLVVLIILSSVLSLIASCSSSKQNEPDYEIFFVTKGSSVETTQGVIKSPYNGVLVSNELYFKIMEQK